VLVHPSSGLAVRLRRLDLAPFANPKANAGSPRFDLLALVFRRPEDGGLVVDDESSDGLAVRRPPRDVQGAGGGTEHEHTPPGLRRRLPPKNGATEGKGSAAGGLDHRE